MTETLPKVAGRARAIILGLGVVYLALAVAGIAVVGWGGIRESEAALLFGVLGVSRLLDIVHAALGVVAILAALRRAPSAFAAVATIVFTAMTAYGVVSGVASGAGDPLHMTWWNVGLYVLSALACAYVYVLRLRVH